MNFDKANATYFQYCYHKTAKSKYRWAMRVTSKDSQKQNDPRPDWGSFMTTCNVCKEVNNRERMKKGERIFLGQDNLT